MVTKTTTGYSNLFFYKGEFKDKSKCSPVVNSLIRIYCMPSCLGVSLSYGWFRKW